MTERNERMLRNLDINKIDKNGRYIDVNIPLIVDLTEEQLEYLRSIHPNLEIAPNARRYKESVVSNENVVKRNSNNVPRYKVTRDQKYNRGRHRTKSKIQFPSAGKIIVGALVITIALGTINFINKDKGTEGYIDMPVQEEVLSDDNKLLKDNQETSNVILDNSLEYRNEDGDNLEFTQRVEDVSAVDLNGTIIKELCDIYHVNYNVVYPFLKEITNNFTSDSYLNGTIDNVTCKGEIVKANSERELLLYAVRCIKQLPGQIGISTQGLYENTEYKSGDNYFEQITKVCNDLGLDRCLMYAIVQSECCFNSELFNNANNPAGIRNNGDWWRFDTKEEGFYELGLEMLKYYRMIGRSPQQVDKDTLSKIRDIHAPLDDGNELWLPNVLENYQYAVMNEVNLFGSTDNTLSVNR